MRTGKQNKFTPEEKTALKEEKELEREKYEKDNMGMYMLLYPLNCKNRGDFNKEPSTVANTEEHNEVSAEQTVLQDNITTEVRPAQVSSKQRNTPVKSKSTRKKSLKELDDEGDVYLKYLKKASTIWEDFTTGKK